MLFTSEFNPVENLEEMERVKVFNNYNNNSDCTRLQIVTKT